MVLMESVLSLRGGGGMQEIGTIGYLDGKAVTVTAEHAPKVLVSVYEKPHGFNEGGFSDKEKFPSLRECTKDNYAISADKIYYRKLTVKECEKLQTVPENYTEGVSKTQRYKMLGNGWTVDVIAHIFGYLK